MTPPRTITGRTRRRETSLRVRTADVAARVLITAAGLGTILAIATVCFFLVSVVLPLFTGGSVSEGDRIVAGLAETDEAPLRTETDEYGVMGWSYFASGRLVVFRLENGRVLDSIDLFGGAKPTCQSFLLRGGDAVFGFDDGTVRLASIRFATRFLDYGELEPRHRALETGQSTDYGTGMVERTPMGQFRYQEVEVGLKDPIRLGDDTPVRLVDMVTLSSGTVLAALTEDMTLHVNRIRETRNIMTGTTTIRLSGGRLAVTEDVSGGRGPGDYLLFEGRGDSATLVWRDGHAARFDTRDSNNPRFAETLRVTEDGARVTSVDSLIGKMTMIVGDSEGRLTSWFRVKPTGVMTTPDGHAVVEAGTVHAPVLSRLRPPGEGEIRGEFADRGSLLVVPTPDAAVLVRQHVLFEGAGEPVTSLGVSKRRRTVAAGFADGHARMFHVTSNRLLADMNVFPTGAAVGAITMGSKEDFIVFTSRDEMSRWVVDMPHPQTTPRTIFSKVWYEGFERPEHVWQSTSGSDEFEPKYGLIPLIFGTLKATVYTMLFGTPLALLAAIYSSEFLHPKTKAKIKPTIEMMASLPSVVLGFLAALVFAPFIEDVVPAAIAAVFTIPFALLLGGFLWQMLPPHTLVRLRPFRLVMVLAMLPVGLASAHLVGPSVEGLLFGGDIKGWLSWAPDPADPAATARSPFRHGTGGWIVLLLPLGALVSAFACGRFVNPLIRRLVPGGSRVVMGLSHLAKFLAGAGVALLVAAFIASLLDVAGLDPRGTVVGTYIQRNAMIVGFVMGFAIIPIIYTLAEDALSAVPEHLRAASLGAGATPWQTATRIIIPTAMSGLFSAVMIGLGRAVGETMIVLMAAGNTPILEWNIFSGFRTLSANIAVELPEAVQNGTNYRMLFLAALTLFAMTFMVNTFAEAVRQRFRKRAFSL